MLQVAQVVCCVACLSAWESLAVCSLRLSFIHYHNMSVESYCFQTSILAFLGFLISVFKTCLGLTWTAKLQELAESYASRGMKIFKHHTWHCVLRGDCVWQSCVRWTLSVMTRLDFRCIVGIWVSIWSLMSLKFLHLTIKKHLFKGSLSGTAQCYCDGRRVQNSIAFHAAAFKLSWSL